MPLASARQHPENQKENQAGHSPERTVEGQCSNKHATLCIVTGPSPHLQNGRIPHAPRRTCGVVWRHPHNTRRNTRLFQGFPPRKMMHPEQSAGYFARPKGSPSPRPGTQAPAPFPPRSRGRARPARPKRCAPHSAQHHGSYRALVLL